jgi:hypothetical protein
MIFEGFNQAIEKWKENKVFFTPYKSKYNMLGVFNSYKSEGFHEIF